MTDWRTRFQALSRRSSTQASFGGEGGGVAAFGVDPGTARAVQAKLNAVLRPSPSLAVDGDFGAISQAALRTYQSQHGLTVDGKPGRETLKSLGVAPPKLPTVRGPKIPGLRQAVTDALPAFQGQFEGAKLPYMYTDSKGLVTTWTGNLVDPVERALALPWVRPDGSAATPDEVRAAWTTVKNAWPGVQSTACAGRTTIRLAPGAGDALLYGQVKTNNDYFAGHYPNFASLPADAQMALHSLGWAWGPAFSRVWGAAGQAFDSAVAALDFERAADVLTQASAHEESVNPGIVPRNEATKELLANAADAVRKKLSYDALYWPGAAAGLALSLSTWLAIGLGGLTAVGLLVASSQGGK
jgi:peptidoglycan hydrolase-like protein with peptidoglycan-binding domain